MRAHGHVELRAAVRVLHEAPFDVRRRAKRTVGELGGQASLARIELGKSIERAGQHGRRECVLSMYALEHVSGDASRRRLDFQRADSRLAICMSAEELPKLSDDDVPFAVDVVLEGNGHQEK